MTAQAWSSGALTQPTGGARSSRSSPGQAALIGHWLDGAAQPLARVLDKLTPAEQQAFLKAMDLLETELHQQDTGARDAP